MIYLRPHKRPKKWPVAVLIAGALLLLTLLFRPIIPESVGELFNTVGAQFWKRETRLGALLKPFGALFTAKQSLLDENEQLMREIQRLKIEQLRTQTAAVEGSTLEKGSPNIAATEHIFASVLVRPSSTPYDILIIDRGRNDGVLVRDLVLANGAAIGWVAHVYSHTSSITLFSSPDMNTSVRLHTEDDAIAVTARGRGNGNFLIEIPQDIVVSEGTAVTIPGSPPIPIGSVSKVVADPADSLQKIYFRLPVNIDELWLVELVHDRQLPVSF
jgi:cell shape-determining protein MreC